MSKYSTSPASEWMDGFSSPDSLVHWIDSALFDICLNVWSAKDFLDL